MNVIQTKLDFFFLLFQQFKLEWSQSHVCNVYFLKKRVMLKCTHQ